jgi:hypothetical protein
MKLFRKKANWILVMTIIFSLGLTACSKTTIIMPKKVPPGQVKKQSAPGQVKKTTGSQSAKPYAPGQKKKKTK